MDCEAIQPLSTATGGPESWELSARAMRGYVDALAARGHKVTLFLIPRLAEEQAPVLQELMEGGVELGMHMHPQTADIGLDAHLGQLSADQQQELLRTGQDRIAAAVGFRPTGFRPGCFSVNDDTFGILVSLGFTHGSVSLPGRTLPAVGAVWAGAEPFAHWVSATNRLSGLCGPLSSPLSSAQGPAETGAASHDVLPFLELPAAVDLNEVSGPAVPPGDVRHLRLEREGILEWGPDLIRRHLARQVELNWWLKSLVVVTHNTRDYGAPAEPCRIALERLCDAIEQTASDLGLTLQPATLAEVYAAALAG